MTGTGASAGLAHVNGFDLACQACGSGRPLVLLHGGFGSVEMLMSRVRDSSPAPRRLVVP